MLYSGSDSGVTRLTVSRATRGWLPRVLEGAPGEHLVLTPGKQHLPGLHVRVRCLLLAQPMLRLEWTGASLCGLQEGSGGTLERAVGLDDLFQPGDSVIRCLKQGTDSAHNGGGRRMGVRKFGEQRRLRSQFLLRTPSSRLSPAPAQLC